MDEFLLEYSDWKMHNQSICQSYTKHPTVGEAHVVARPPAQIQNVALSFAGLINQPIVRKDDEALEVTTHRLTIDPLQLEIYDFSENYLYSMAHLLSIHYDGDFDHGSKPFDNSHLTQFDMKTNEVIIIRCTGKIKIKPEFESMLHAENRIHEFLNQEMST